MNEKRAASITAKTVGLKKTIGLMTGVSLIVSNIIGSGIFVSPKGVLAATNSVGLCLILWVLCGLIPLLGAFCYAELALLIPESGGEFIYIYRGCGRLHRRLGELLAFLYSWSIIVIIKPTSCAILGLISATYLLNPIIGKCGPPETLLKLTAICIIMIVAFLNSFSVKLTNKIVVVLTQTKIFTLVIILIGGIVRLFQGHTKNFQDSFSGTSSSVFGIVSGFFNGLWAYDGWNALNSVVEEIKNPKRNLPLSIFISIPLCILLYVLVNISYFTVMTKTELLAAKGVGLTWADLVLGPYFSWIMPVAVSLSVFSTMIVSMYTAARINYVAAREGMLIKALAMINVNRHTPEPSVLVTASIGIIFATQSNVRDLVNLFSLTTWGFHGLTGFGLLVIRYQTRHTPSAFKTPIAAPIAFLIISLYLTISPFIDDAKIEYIGVLVFEVIGCFVYLVFVYFKLEIPYFNYVTIFVQNVLQVDLPTKKDNIEE